MHGNDQDSARITEFNLHEHDYGRETHFVGDSQTARSIDRLYELIEERIPKPAEADEDSARLAAQIRELTELFERNVDQLSARIGLMTGESHICSTCGGEHRAA
jgi:ribosomal protein S15P/S13E